jgi:excinuclease UvrABC helicase subunit UvrB
MNNQIKELIKNLREQNNRITANPIFTVQRKERIYGLDSSYSDDHIWLDQGDEIYDEDLIMELNRKDYDFEDIDKRYYKCYYRDEWINVQPFFTEVAANRYLDINGHNLGGRENCRIYVESGYRNAEWQAIREYFLNLKDNNE